MVAGCGHQPPVLLSQPQEVNDDNAERVPARDVGRLFGGPGLGRRKRGYGLGMDAPTQFVGVRSSGLERRMGQGYQRLASGVAAVIKAWRRLKDNLPGLPARAKLGNIRALAGVTLLFLTGLIYLGPYAADTASCVDSSLRDLIAGSPIEWQCYGDVLEDLRKDGAAAGVILAIAAAILASAWSSGLDSDADAVE